MDSNFIENEQLWEKIKNEILGDDSGSKVMTKVVTGKKMTRKKKKGNKKL